MTGGLYTQATYGGLYSEGRFALERAGIPNAALDARVLLQHATRRTWEWLFSEEDEIAAPGEIAAFSELIDRRIAHMPLAQIVGHKEFWSLDFEVDTSVLIPRPESEHVIERALELVPKDASGRVLDLGTGSGCLIIALLKERPKLTGLAVDLSCDALEVARKNAGHHGVANRCAFVQGDWAEAIEGCFDLVVSNPPYLSDAELSSAAPEVKDHEPHLALSSGADGLEAYRVIAHSLPRLLAPQAFVVLEIGSEQARSISAVLKSAGLDSIVLGTDLAGHDRVISAQNPRETRDLGPSKKRLESAS